MIRFSKTDVYRSIYVIVPMHLIIHKVRRTGAYALIVTIILVVRGKSKLVQILMSKNQKRLKLAFILFSRVWYSVYCRILSFDITGVKNNTKQLIWSKFSLRVRAETYTAILRTGTYTWWFMGHSKPLVVVRISDSSQLWILVCWYHTNACLWIH